MKDIRKNAGREKNSLLNEKIRDVYKRQNSAYADKISYDKKGQTFK